MKGSGVRRGGCPETKRVPGWNGFTLRYHDTTNVNKREKETHTHTHTEKYQTQSIDQNIKN